LADPVVVAVVVSGPKKVSTLPLALPHGLAKAMVARVVPPDRINRFPAPESSMAVITPLRRSVIAVCE